MALPNWFIRFLGNFLPLSTYSPFPRETPEGIIFCLDSPEKLKPKQQEFFLRGWCFSKSQRIEALRITTPAGRRKVRYGIERRDLQESFPNRPDSVLYTGFEVSLTMPWGSSRFTLEAQLEDGSWRPVITEYFTRPLLAIFHRDNFRKGLQRCVPWRFIRLLGNFLPVSTYRPLPRETPEGIVFSLDSPRKLRPKQREFLFRGWCFSKTQRLKAVRIITPTGWQKVRYGIERHDLLEAFQDWSDSVLHAGFEVPVTVPRGSTRFTVEVQLEDGSWHTVITEYFIRPLLNTFHREKIFKGLQRYVRWTKEHDQLSPRDRKRIAQHIRIFETKPLISIVVPTYNTEVKLLDKMMHSVLDQLYDNWELCIADDNSTRNSTRRRLRYWENRDERIKVTFRTENGHISACSNSALELVTGKFIALLDHDDELAPHALYLVALEILTHPDCQLIYSDEDKISVDGYRSDPYFKPDFSRDLLCSHNFVSHLCVYRSDLVRKLGGFREEFVGSQDWDLVLRCLDHVEENQIRHIQRVLYHWRLTGQSTSASMRNKRYAVDSGRRALQEYLSKHESHAEVLDGPTLGSFRIRYDTPGNPLVSIIIPTRNNAALLERCIDSIRAMTGYPRYELIIVDNGSDDPQSKDLLASLEKSDKARVFAKPMPFNFSRLNNWAARRAEGDILLFLNDDIEVIEEDWLREMVSHAMRKTVGPVGAKLIFPDGYNQHAGMILGIGGVAGHAFKFLHRSNPGHIGRAGIIQNYSAVTAACMAIRRDVFEEVGGFDEENLGTAYNDADLCLRAWEKGYRTVWTPHALLIHHESASRGLEDNPEKKKRWQSEADYMLSKWKPQIENDPFYNPALSLQREDFSLAQPPRYARPWEQDFGKQLEEFLPLVGWPAFYHRLPWTPDLQAKITSVSQRLQIGRMTLQVDILMPRKSGLTIKIDGNELAYNVLKGAPSSFSPSAKECTLSVATTLIPLHPRSRFSVGVAPHRQNRPFEALGIPVCNLIPDRIEEPFLCRVEAILDRPDFGTRVIWGWCFGLNPLKVGKIRARLDHVKLDVETHLPRKDVKTAYPNEPDADRCGFECELPAGKKSGTIKLDCQLEGNAFWTEFYQGDLASLEEVAPEPDPDQLPQVVEHRLQSRYNLDTIFVEQQRKLRTKLLGWVFLKDGPTIEGVRILIRDGTLKCRYGLQREDVLAEFPGQANAIYCGFEANIEEVTGNPTLVFQLQVMGGDWITFDQRKPAQIKTTYYQKKKIPATESGVMANVENARIERRFGHQFAISGWCFRTDGKPVSKIRIRIDKETFPGKPGIERTDVHEKFHTEYPVGLHAGFEIPLSKVERNAKLNFEYKIPRGGWTLFAVEDFSKFPVSHFATYSEERSDYQKWLTEYDSLLSIPKEKARVRMDELSLKPLISIVLPVYDTPEKYLRKALDSVRRQYYPNWELCLADDASSLDHVKPVIEEFAAEEPRIKTVYRQENGHISRASNSALKLASGEWCTFLDHDDELTPDALFRVVESINRNPHALFFYSDEDTLDADGNRRDPYFKPDWNLELLEGQNFICHLAVIRRELIERVGGFEPGMEGSQDWDLFLKITESLQPEQIVHIPYVLYHWRAVEGSTALSLEEKSYVRKSSRKALEGHCARAHPGAKVFAIAHGHWRIKHPLPEPAPEVSIIIPTRDQAEILRACIRSVQNSTSYTNFNILVVDNQSVKKETHELFAELRDDGIRVLPYDKPFNFSAINNYAAARAGGDILLFLNNDIIVNNFDWLEEMVSHFGKNRVGAVGAKLYYPEDLIQHAGVILGINGVAGHCFKYAEQGEPGQRNRLNLVQQFSAVTAACMAVKKSVFEAIGGFEEEHLGVAFNDVDLCLRMREAGYSIIWTPHAQLYHHESLSRGDDSSWHKDARVDEEIEYMMSKWSSILPYDPNYNPNLTLEFEDFSLAWPPRLPKA